LDKPLQKDLIAEKAHIEGDTRWRFPSFQCSFYSRSAEEHPIEDHLVLRDNGNPLANLNWKESTGLDAQYGGDVLLIWVFLQMFA
jgi:hypothetical protein